MQLLTTILILAASVLVLSAGAKSLSRDQDSPTAFLFFLSTLGASIWLIALSFILSSDDPSTAMAWGKASYIGILLIPISVLHFICSLVNRLPRWPWTVLGWTITFLLAITAAGTDLFITSPYLYDWGYYTRLTTAGTILPVWTVGLLAAGLALLIRHYLRTRDTFSKRRLRLLVIAFAIGELALIDFLPSLGVGIPPVGFLGIAVFAVITSRALATMTLTRLAPVYAANQILATMQGAVLVTDMDGHVRVANDAALELLRYPNEQIVELQITDIVESPFNVGRASDTLMRGETIQDRAMLWRTEDERLIEVGVSASIFRTEDGMPTGVVYVASDISERNRARQIEYQAFHDSLTGLPNRAFLRRLLNEMLEEQDESGLVPAVIFIDLDGFKIVNDSLGHSAGDELLQAVASRLREVVRTGDRVCRLGGDEFVVLMKIASPDHATGVGQKILASIQERITIDGEVIHVSGSLGIALYPDHGTDSETLLKNADSAMYAAKEAGKNRIVVCGPQIARRASQRFRLETELRQAISREEFELYYQPIIDLETQEPVGGEALLRWRRDGSLISPADFLPVAEETGLITEMGEWALFMACREVNAWISLANRPLRVSVNLSAEQLRDRSITEAVSSALALNELAPACLVLEVTESAAMRSVEQSIKILSELKDLDVQIAIDDFGTGYSSLSYLQRFPIDLLKIDRSFIIEMGRSRRSSAIVSATVAMARALELEVVAEGVETRYQLAALRIEQCRYAQGYAFGRPMPSQDFRAHLLGWNRTTIPFEETSSFHARPHLPSVAR